MMLMRTQRSGFEAALPQSPCMHASAVHVKKQVQYCWQQRQTSSRIMKSQHSLSSSSHRLCLVMRLKPRASELCRTIPYVVSSMPFWWRLVVENNPCFKSRTLQIARFHRKMLNHLCKLFTKSARLCVHYQPGCRPNAWFQFTCRPDCCHSTGRGESPGHRSPALSPSEQGESWEQ